MKKALITGIDGQDGSYLAEFLLEKGYKVHGMVRRVALEDQEHHLWRIKHILNKINLHPASLESYPSIFKLVEKVKPDECYHLAAQSFVSYSFEDEFSTINTNINGTHFVLSAIKEKAHKCKFYFAASSEMFGLVKETPQNENTPFHPRSPYGISKVAGFDLTRNYREAYGLFACNGILFNHESLPKNSPVIIKKDRLIDILPIEDLFHKDKHIYEGIKDEYKNQLIWNGSEWTKIINGTVYIDKRRKLNLIQTREAAVELTDGHYLFDENNREIKAEDVKKKNRLYKIELPKEKNKLNDADADLAYFIGYIVGDGHIDERGRVRITGTNKKEILRVGKTIINKYGWAYRIKTWGVGRWPGSRKKVWQLDINNDVEWGLWLKKHIYTLSKEKKIPQFILNNNPKVKSAFFNGYYDADGRMGGHERYPYKGWTTKSAALNLGLIFLINELTGQKAKTKAVYRGGNRYYYTQLRSTKTTNKGKHLLKDLNEVVKISKICNFKEGAFFDLQTESQTFASGPNLVKIHNSPRRGFEFVTRKITNRVAEIKLGLAKELRLGNLEAKRDWGFAGDYVRAMWLMLQQPKPEDYVIATGETHSVREFAEFAFSYVGLNWKDYVLIDKTYYRPAEVHLLKGNYSKAKKKLGWEPKVNFKALVKMMVDGDLERLKIHKKEYW